MYYFDGVPVRWDKLKPGCAGCIYLGSAIPCQYILITGKSPQSQGAHIDPEGPGGCELKETKQWRRRKAPTPLPQTQLAPQKAAEVQPPSLPAKSAAHRKKPSKLDAPEFFGFVPCWEDRSGDRRGSRCGNGYRALLEKDAGTSDQMERAKAMTLSAVTAHGRAGGFIPFLAQAGSTPAHSAKGRVPLSTTSWRRRRPDKRLAAAALPQRGAKPCAPESGRKDLEGFVMAEQRPIDANELMNEVDRSERDNPHTDGIARSTHRHEHRHFMAMISDAPTIEAEPRWIPVTEKLPEGSKEDRGAGHAWWSWAFKNSVCMICWMVLAVYFGKWWIALCAVLTATNLRTSHNGGVSAEKCDGQR